MADEALVHEGLNDASEVETKRSPEFMLRAELLRTVPLSMTVIWRLMKRDDFPRPVQLSPNQVAWRRAEVEEWVQSRERVAA